MMAASVVNLTFELDSFSFFVPHEYLYHIGIAQLFAYRRWGSRRERNSAHLVLGCHCVECCFSVFSWTLGYGLTNFKAETNPGLSLILILISPTLNYFVDVDLMDLYQSQF